MICKSGTSLEGMGATINKILVIGNLGRDPEMRYTPNGQQEFRCGNPEG